MTKIGDLAFYGCNSLKKISIPSSVIEIGNDVFREYSLLTDTTIYSLYSKIKSVKNLLSILRIIQNIQNPFSIKLLIEMILIFFNSHKKKNISAFYRPHKCKIELNLKFEKKKKNGHKFHLIFK